MQQDSLHLIVCCHWGCTISHILISFIIFGFLQLNEHWVILNKHASPRVTQALNHHLMVFLFVYVAVAHTTWMHNTTLKTKIKSLAMQKLKSWRNHMQRILWGCVTTKQHDEHVCLPENTTQTAAQLMHAGQEKQCNVTHPAYHCIHPDHKDGLNSPTQSHLKIDVQ